MLDDFEFCFPKIDDFAGLLISLGSGALMWKRDLSRFFLQLPLDPLEYNKVCFVWRGTMFFFTSFVWGCRHAGMNGQRVSNLISAIHRSLGSDPSLLKFFVPEDSLEDFLPQFFNTLNYSDDFASAESSLQHANLSFQSMGALLEYLGFSE